MNKREITILYDRSVYTYSWIKTLMWAKKEFKEAGIIVKYSSFWDFFPFANRIPEKRRDTYESDRLNKFLNKEYDIVFIAYHHGISYLGKSEEVRIHFLEKLRSRAKMICWLDTADSTGTCLFDVLPYVDLYFKKQILADTSMYLKQLYFDRLYCQYYHEKFSVSSADSIKYSRQPLNSNDN